MNAKKDQSGNPEEWKFSKVRVLVVDEGSLVSVQILHSILSMLTKHAELQKFIILGKGKLHVHYIAKSIGTPPSFEQKKALPKLWQQQWEHNSCI